MQTNLTDHRLLILSYSPLHSDPRILRQIEALKDLFSITACGYTAPGITGIEFVPLDEAISPLQAPLYRQLINHLKALIPDFLLDKLRRLRNALSRNSKQGSHNQPHESQVFERDFEQRYWHGKEMGIERIRLLWLKERNFSMIIANEIETLPLALALRKSHTKVWCDLHEYAPREQEEDPVWMARYAEYREYLCKTYLAQADVLSTVSEGISKEYARSFRIPEPEVITNAPAYLKLTPSESAADMIQLVHHGICGPARGQDILIEAMEHLGSNFRLNFMLMRNNPSYLQHLRLLARNDSRVSFLETVPTTQIPIRLNAFDVGVYILKPSNFNNKFALPNKFFEFIQARLAIAIGPSPAMASLVESMGVGVVSEDFSAAGIANVLAGLNRERIMNFKFRANDIAKTLSAENNRKFMRERIGSLVNS